MNPLAAAVRAAVAAAGGWLSFADFMALALYHPRYGYYAAGRARFGGDGDFTTAPHMSPLFARCAAAQIADVLRQTGGGVLELGAGDGLLASGILSALAAGQAAPDGYAILEPSAALRRRQQKRFANRTIKPKWLSRLPSAHQGVVIANEVLDATPCAVVRKQNGEWRERGVVCDAGGGFRWRDAQTPSAEAAARLDRFDLPDGYITEINPRMEALIRTLAEMLSAGAILIWDYGFGAGEFYHPQRVRGTLMCHHRHRAHDDPFFAVGEQDITSHIDFSAAAEAAADGGAQLLGYATQANFLINCGVLDLLKQAAAGAESEAARARLNAGVHKLLAPQEMGELFKAAAFGKGVSSPLLGFVRGGAEHRL